MAKNWEYAAGVLWPVLVKAAKGRETPYYSDLAPLINTNPLSVRMALEPIQAHCMDYKLPPLSSIVIGKTTGLPGEGFIAWDIDDIKTAHEIVYQHPWELIGNPFGGFDKNDSTETLSKELVEDPNKAKDIYRKVKVRGTAQAIFRAALLKAYEGKCAICDLSFKEALEAAHIIPWSKSTDEEKISPCNGILLCSNHHKLFDSGRIKITAELNVRLSDQGDSFSKADKAATVEVNLKPFRLPKSVGLRPSVELIRKRNHGYEH